MRLERVIMQTKAIALCRVSSPGQRIEGHSLETQEDNVKKASETLNVPIIKMWSHDVSSRIGKNENRKDLAEIIDFCKIHHDIKYLIIDVPDRFMREVETYYYFKFTLKKLGVKLYYASEPDLNSDDSFARLKENLQVIAAEMSNRERMVKCSTGLKNRLRAGYYPFCTHQGYRKTITPGLAEPDPFRFPLLQKAFQNVASRVMTPAEAHKWLNSTDYTTRTGKKLKIDKFLKLLRDSYYCGIVEAKATFNISVKGLHTAMITPSEHEIILEILDGKQTKYLRKLNNPDFPLNRSFCECGGKLVGFYHQNGRGWKRPEYRCRSCGKQYKRDSIHDSLDLLLKSIELSDSKIDKIVKCFEIVWREHQEYNLGYIANLENKISELQAKKSSLILSLAEHPELTDDIKESVETLKNEIKETQSSLDEAKNVESDLIEFIEFSLRMAYAFETQWWTISHENRQKCKNLLFPNDFFVKSDEKVYTNQISPLYRFVSIKKEPDLPSDSHLVELRGIAPLSKKRFHNY